MSTQKRFEYIIKNHGEQKAYLVFIILLNAVALHDEMEMVTEIYKTKYLDHKSKKVITSNNSITFDELFYVCNLKEILKSGKTAYDKYLPWIAKNIRDLSHADHIKEILPAISDWAENKKPNIFSMDIDEVTKIIKTYEIKIKRVIPGEVIYRFSDGWSVHRLMDLKQFIYEGLIMQNCIRDYNPTSLQKLNRYLYSLRDPSDRPHCTMEYDHDVNCVLQIRGKNNNPPKIEYLKKMIVFRKEYMYERDREAKNEFDCWLKGAIKDDIDMDEMIENIYSEGLAWKDVEKEIRIHQKN